MKGYIPLYRKMMDWEWYDEANTMRLFVHCLLKANHKDAKWRGHDVKKGSFITSIATLAHELKMSKQNVRTAIANLETTGEITRKPTHHYTVINVVNWALYEVKGAAANTQDNTHLTHGQHTPNTRLTTVNNDKNEKNDKKKDVKDNVGKPDDVPYTEIVSYLNELIGTRYKATTPKTKELIRARWNEGFRTDDFKAVIEIKKAEWLGDTKMEKYLRPSTLFGTRFESYLNQLNDKRVADGVRKGIPKDVDVDWFDDYLKRQGKT